MRSGTTMRVMGPGGTCPLAPTKLSNRAAELEDGGQGRCQSIVVKNGRGIRPRHRPDGHGLGPGQRLHDGADRLRGIPLRRCFRLDHKQRRDQRQPLGDTSRDRLPDAEAPAGREGSQAATEVFADFEQARQPRGQQNARRNRRFSNQLR
jgi:hypothetical protein